MGVCENVLGTQLIPIDPAMIKPPSDEPSEELTSRCHIVHIDQIRQATIVRSNFEKSLHVQSSGMRLLDGDHYILRVKYEINTENPPIGLRLRHWNGGFAEYTIEKAICPDEDQVDLEVEFSARDENGDQIKDSEAHVPMKTQVIDEEGNVYAQIDWYTGINDIFD
ncbi:hypothetical protein M3Y97_00440600 [Aphelenchoides bicaudatus]|nr:hypothetical protein M3Y97_00440600 [Aphelenchoides bicaudatus]